MSKHLPPIESLRIFEACVRHSSFTRAAGELGITPAAVSLRMRNLEADLGRRLFNRSGPALEPTEAAVALAARVAEALSIMRLAVEDCGRPVESLRLTAVPSFATRWLAPRLAHYHQRPNATSIQLDVSTEVRQPSQFDMAIRTGRGTWPDFDATPLLPVDITPMMSPMLAARVRCESPADLTRLPLLPHTDWLRWFLSVGVRAPNLQFGADEYPTYELDAAAAVEGAGVALLSPTLFASLLQEGKLVQPFAAVMQGPSWHFLLLKQGERRASVLEFRAWLQMEIGEPRDQRACTV